MQSIILHHKMTVTIIIFNVCFWRAPFALSTFHLNVILKHLGTLLFMVIGDMLGCLVSRSRVTWCVYFSWGHQFFNCLEVRRESGYTVYTCQQQKFHINPRESGMADSGCSQNRPDSSSRFTGLGAGNLISPAPGMPENLFISFVLFF